MKKRNTHDLKEHGLGPNRRELLRDGAAFLALTTLLSGCRSVDRDALRAARDDEVPKTDPALVKYREEIVLKTDMPRVRAVTAAKDGSLWIVGDGVAQRWAVSGERSEELEVRRFSGTANCAALLGDTLLVGATDRVMAVAKDGEARVWASPGEGTTITCIATSDTTVLVADAGKRRVLRYDVTGKLTDTLCERDEATGYKGLIVPSPHLDVALSADGTMHIVNPGTHTIEVRDPDGSLRFTWGKSSQEMDGFSGCCNPTDLALLSDGRYVTSEKGIPRVKIYDSFGHFQCVVAGPEHLSSGVVGLDLAAMPDGRIAVVDPGLNAVRVFAPKETA